MRSTQRWARSGSTSRAASRSEKPTIAVSGVRSSWLMRERKRFVASFAAIRPAFASCSSLARRMSSASNWAASSARSSRSRT